MKKFSKIFSFILIVTLCLSMLNGCGISKEKLPKPEELMSEAFGTEEVSSIKATVIADIEANVSMASMGISGNMELACNMNVEIAGDVNGNAFTKGYIDYDMLGISGTKKVETYEIVGDKEVKTYIFDDKSSTWKTESLDAANGKNIITSILDMVDIEKFNKDSLVVTADNERYNLKGIIKSSELKTDLEILNQLIGSENLISNDIVFNVFLDFDKETKTVQSIKFVLDVENATDDIKAIYDNVALTILVNEINTVKIEAPQEALGAQEENLNVPDESASITETEDN